MHNPRRKHISEDFYGVKETGYFPVSRTGEILHNGVRTKGGSADYHYVYIDGKRTPVHRLVALTFIPDSRDVNKLDVNHIDGNKFNNSVNNLEWTTRRENNLHAVKYGLNIQASNILVKNLYTGDVKFFYSIQQAASWFQCAGGAVHNYLKNMRFKKPFRGNWSIIFDGESWPSFTQKQISIFGHGVKDTDVIISLSLKDDKHVITPNLKAAKIVFGDDLILDKPYKDFIHCYLKDIGMFTEDIHEVLISADKRYDLIGFNRKPVNKKPVPIKVMSKITGETRIIESVRKFAEELGISYTALKRSIWRTKGDFKGYLIEYIK